jgi:hypothetical protein
MPFTLSHAAAVLPVRRYGILSALVVGSFVPDILYFIPRAATHLPTGSGGYGHTLPGLFFFCLPLGLAALFIFHTLLKRPLISLFPAAHQQKLTPIGNAFTFFPVSQFVKIIGSILLGAASHLTWDAFTHHNGWMVEQFDFLRVRVAVTSHLQMGLYDLLQYGSSVLGLMVLAFYYFRWLRETPPVESPHLEHLSISPVARMLLLLTFAAGAVAPSIVRFWLSPVSISFGRTFLGYSAILGMKVLTLEIVVFSIAWHFRRFWQGNQPGPVSD